MKPVEGKFYAILYGSDTAWEFHYSSKFSARRALMLHAVNLGWSLEDCYSAFTNPRNPGSRLWTHGSNERLLTAAETDRRIWRDHESAVRRALDNPQYRNAAEARQRIGEIIAIVRAVRWQGRSGRTDRDTLLFALRRATEVGSDRVGISIRDAAIGSGITPSTAAKSLRRLVKAGWLSYGKRERTRYSNTYKCVIPTHIILSDVVQIHVSANDAPFSAGHEVWARLGKAARAIYYSLSAAPATARKLAKSADVGSRTADRQLPILASYGLAKRTDEGWITGPRSPDDVMVDMGWIENNSKVERRRREAEQDRELFRWKFPFAA